MEWFNRKTNGGTYQQVDWRARRRTLVSRLYHPCPITRVIECGFPSYQTAAREVRRLEKRKKVHFNGRLQMNDTGRPSDIFCTRWIKRDHLEHEVKLTEWLLDSVHEDARRGYDCDQKLRPDAEIVRNGYDVNVEMDMGTERYKQILGRMRKYAKCPEYVLWICQNEHRMHEMMRRAKVISSTALFTVFGTQDWFDLEGEKV